MGQEAGEKWTAAAYLQPTLLLPPTLLAGDGGWVGARPRHWIATVCGLAMTGAGAAGLLCDDGKNSP